MAIFNYLTFSNVFSSLMMFKLYCWIVKFGDAVVVLLELETAILYTLSDYLVTCLEKKKLKVQVYCLA